MSKFKIDSAQYDKLYKWSIDDPQGFWAAQSDRLQWIRKWEQVSNCSFDNPHVHIEWFTRGKINASINCLDRHLASRGKKTALIWAPDDPTQPSRSFTYEELHREVMRWGQALRFIGAKRGDRITIYMPMIPEAVFAMLACSRIGACHCVVFAGFSPDALAERIQDSESEFIITCDEGRRAGKNLPIKANMDAALDKCAEVRKVLIHKTNTKAQSTQKLELVPERDITTEEVFRQLDHLYHGQIECAPSPMDSEDPLFILYTSGSTSKPKGVLHSTAGYLLYASLTHESIFDLREDDVYWCTADIGWVTGHTYGVYGPLCNGATTLLFEGGPHYPDSSRFWQIVDQHKVSLFYTAPTALRSLMRDGDEWVKKTSRSSLRILGTVGEPINPEAWNWYHQVVGEGRCPIVDTWWQTETGGALITPLPGATKLKPGSATLPFFGIQPVLLDEEGKEIKGEGSGYLCLKGSWPGQMRTVYKDHKRFQDTYFSTYQGYYFTGDGARRDADGYYWITGRVDDVLNVSGHRLGTAEIESALVGHPAVAEAAVVGVPHAIKGQGIYAFVTLRANAQKNQSKELKQELLNWVRQGLSPIAVPDHIQWAPQLPKTRSGKIMRRILRKIAEGEEKNFGDTSTLAEPAVVEELLRGREQSTKKKAS